MPVASVQPVTDPADERLADYVSLTDVALRSRQEPAKGLYIAESSTVLGRALAAGHRPRSVLLSPRWLPDLERLLAGPARRRHRRARLRRRRARARGDHRVPRAPRSARGDAPAAARAGRRPAGRCPARRRAGGHRRPHQRRCRLPVGRGARGGRRAGHPALRRPAVPPVGPRLDGDRVPGAVDADRPVARRASPCCARRASSPPRWRCRTTRSRSTSWWPTRPSGSRSCSAPRGTGSSRVTVAAVRPGGADPDGGRGGLAERRRGGRGGVLGDPRLLGGFLAGQRVPQEAQRPGPGLLAGVLR